MYSETSLIWINPPNLTLAAPDTQVPAEHAHIADGGELIGCCDTADMGGTHAVLQNQALVS